jgi:hypothetical protein
MMSELNLQCIVDHLQGVLPDEWKKIIFRAEYTEGSYSMKYYADLGTGDYVDCYSLSQFTKAHFIKGFMAIDKVISPVRKSLSSKEKWSALTLIIDETGAFKADYCYDNIEGATIEFHNEWEKKYLGKK